MKGIKRFQKLALAALLALLCAPNRAAENSPADEVGEVVVLPVPIRDPIEPVNRAVWTFNKGLMLGVVKPTGKVYRAITPGPVRTGIRNVGRNLGYPRRLINNAVRGHWIASRDETYRMLANTTMGLGGIFDVGTDWFHIKEWEADFGETFGIWGWHPQIYLMVPVYGPSNDRDALGSILDSLANPLNYFQPYNYINTGITYNNLAHEAETYARAIKSEFDPYYPLRAIWTYKRTPRPLDFAVTGEPDLGALDTLGTFFFKLQDPDFTARAKNKKVRMETTGEDLPFTYWLRPDKAPIVYLAPGLGAHRFSGGTVALAELLYNAGFSVATIASAYNYEFIQTSLSSPLPGHMPSDARDYHIALTKIDAYLEKKYPKRLGSKAMMGYSMGGFFTMHLAATNDPALLQFDRYVAIDAPMRLLNGVKTLDSFFNAALEWPAAERAERIENTLRKATYLAENAGSMKADSAIPLSANEARFIIGLAFRLALRDVIFNSQRLNNQNILREPFDKRGREAVYREILRYSFSDYLKTFVAAHYATKGIDINSDEAMRATSLRSYEDALKGNKSVRLVENANDILLEASDVEWMRATFGDRLQLFERGGHMGNLAHPAVQAAILGAIADLREGGARP